MSAQRAGISALRRVAVEPTFFTQRVSRAVIASSLSSAQTRPLSTEKLTPADSNALLNAQRLRRPLSPHLSTYDLKQTWFGGSIWMRITGGGFSAALYGYALAYLAAPLTGWHLETASLAAAFGALPLAVKGGFKFLLAWPFVFHAFNGVNFLLKDIRVGYKKVDIIRYGWAVWAASLVTSLGLVAFL